MNQQPYICLTSVVSNCDRLVDFASDIVLLWLDIRTEVMLRKEASFLRLKSCKIIDIYICVCVFVDLESLNRFYHWSHFLPFSYHSPFHISIPHLPTPHLLLHPSSVSLPFFSFLRLKNSHPICIPYHNHIILTTYNGTVHVVRHKLLIYAHTHTQKKKNLHEWKLVLFFFYHHWKYMST